MQQLEDVSRANGIDIPLSFNNPNMVADSWSMDFAPGAEGDVDVVGLDRLDLFSILRSEPGSST